MAKKKQAKCNRYVITNDGAKHLVIDQDNRFWVCEDARYLKYKEGSAYLIACEVPEENIPKDAEILDGVEVTGGEGEPIKAKPVKDAEVK